MGHTSAQVKALFYCSFSAGFSVGTVADLEMLPEMAKHNLIKLLKTGNRALCSAGQLEAIKTLKIVCPIIAVAPGKVLQVFFSFVHRC